MITRIITTVKSYDLSDGIWREKVEYYGLSSDVKPVDGVQNADIFYEMDGPAVYMFDEENSVWHKQTK